MIVTVEHAITGERVSKELDVTQEQLDRWAGGELIQNVFPDLDPDDREFIMTGMSQAEWDKLTEEDDEGLELSDGEALASAGRGTDEDYRPEPDPLDDISF